jgi:hypothetical protein
LDVDFDALTGVVSIVPFRDIERTNDHNDWRAYQTNDPVRIGRPTGTGWKVKYEADNSDKLYKELNITTEFGIGDAEQTYSVGLGTLPMLRAKNETRKVIGILRLCPQKTISNLGCSLTGECSLI